MDYDFRNISVDQICQIINLLHPCMDDYVYIYDIENDFYYISPAAVKRFKLPNYQFHDVLSVLEALVYPSDFPRLTNDLTEVINGGKQFHDMQYRWLDINDEPVWINCRGYVLASDSKIHYMVGCINEIGIEQKADNVSGLLGISSFREYVTEHTDDIPQGYIMRLGLDDFKEVNEKLGINYGNVVLKRTADYISECLLPGQKLYRAVADEFLVVDFKGNSVEAAIEQYNCIRKSIDKFVEDTLYEVVFTISGGILPSEQCLNNPFLDVLRFSEFSLNEAKRNGKNCCYVFSDTDYNKFIRQRHLTQLLRQSVTHDFEGFEAYLQPLFNTATNSLYGAETLMRFKTAEYGMVSPGEFIPLLEETGLILPVGKWMLNKSLELCNKIHTVAPDFKISINISYIQVLKSNIITEILSAVTDHDVPPATVIIELTESGLVAPDSRITKLWSRMKEKGISLALDDFGTGYSNFHYINDLKPDIIKIDRSFTIKALQNEYEFNLLSLMSNMAHSMNLRVCIEGIETDDELERIKAIMPDYCQGYYFGKPCPFDEFCEKYLPGDILPDNVLSGNITENKAE